MSSCIDEKNNLEFHGENDFWNPCISVLCGKQNALFAEDKYGARLFLDADGKFYFRTAAGKKHELDPNRISLSYQRRGLFGAVLSVYDLGCGALLRVEGNAAVLFFGRFPRRELIAAEELLAVLEANGVLVCRKRDECTERYVEDALCDGDRFLCVTDAGKVIYYDYGKGCALCPEDVEFDFLARAVRIRSKTSEPRLLCVKKQHRGSLPKLAGTLRKCGFSVFAEKKDG